jgi:proteasome accessory factor B
MMRMFERDKDELRSFGVPIETVEKPDGDASAYRLSPVNFYLPYLCVAGDGERAPTQPSRVDRDGYRALATLSFEPDELAAVAAAAARVRELRNPQLSADAESAMRKLAIDLPVAADAEAEVKLLSRAPKVEEEIFATVSDALLRSKVLHFDYYAIDADRSEARSVEPYGLFFLGSHWYLAGRDLARGELRNFRLGRLTRPRVSASRAHTPDFQIPESFQLREHAHSRQAWELGAGDQMEAVVRFGGSSGAAEAGRKLGGAIRDQPDCRQFKVRRVDSFVRWLLSFGGDAVPLSPPQLVRAYRDALDATLAIYLEAEQGEIAERRTP